MSMIAAPSSKYLKTCRHIDREKVGVKLVEAWLQVNDVGVHLAVGERPCNAEKI